MAYVFNHNRLKHELQEIFEHQYPFKVAQALAIMHVQLHLEFAKGLAAVPLDPRDPCHLVQGRMRVNSAIQGLAQDTDAHKRMGTADKPEDEIDVENEILSVFESLDENVCLSLTDLPRALSPFDISPAALKSAVVSLEKQGKIARTAKTRGAKYRLVRDSDPEEPEQED